MILFDETIRQAADDGTPFVDVLARQGIVPGVKVDRGSKALAGAPGEQATEGLTGSGSAWPSTASSARASPSGAR